MYIYFDLLGHAEAKDILDLQRELFVSNLPFIVVNVNPDDVKDHLVSKHLVGHSAYESLNLEVKTSAEKNRIIVDELCRGGIGTLEKFLLILKSASKTMFVAEKLESGKYVLVDCPFTSQCLY